MTPRVTSTIRYLSGEGEEGLPPTLADLPPRPPPNLVDMMRGWTPDGRVNLDVLGPPPSTMETVGALAPLAGAALFAPSLPLALATIPAYHYLTSGKVQELPSIPSMPGEPWATALDIATGVGGGKSGLAGGPSRLGAIDRLRARVGGRMREFAVSESGEFPPQQPIKPLIDPREMERAGSFEMHWLKPGEPGIATPSHWQGPQARRFVYRDRNGKPQGYLDFKLDEAGTGILPDSIQVYVNPEVRRQGVGSALYDAAKEAGFDLSNLQDRVTTPEGASFLNRRYLPE